MNVFTRASISTAKIAQLLLPKILEKFPFLCGKNTGCTSSLINSHVNVELEEQCQINQVQKNQSHHR